jgi:hypothetical protein
MSSRTAPFGIKDRRSVAVLQVVAVWVHHAELLELVSP